MLYTQGGGETLQAVISGSADIGVAAGTLGALGAFAKGAPVRIIGAQATGAADYTGTCRRTRRAEDAEGRDRRKHHRLFDQRLVDATRGRSAFIKQYGLKAKADRDRQPAGDLHRGDVRPGRCRLGGAAVRPRGARQKARSASSPAPTTCRRCAARPIRSLVVNATVRWTSSKDTLARFMAAYRETDRLDVCGRPRR